MSFILLSIIIFGIDQLTKILLYGINKSLIGDFLWLKTVFNEGAAWGIGSGGRWIFIGVSLLAAALFIYLLFSKKYFKSKYFKITIAVLLGGLIGNLFDRIFLGGVRDFIYFKFINFPVFNVADIAITIGTIMMIVYIIFLYHKTDGKKQEQTKVEGE